MVVDTSAILAILFEEPEAERFADRLVASRVTLASALNWLEAAIVVEARKGQASAKDFERFIATARIQVVEFDGEQAALALTAWRRYGKGRHPAGLNLGDCCAYALSKSSGEPLLYKGGDFAKTDVATVSD
jgi:ribonuclease VapC